MGGLGSGQIVHKKHPFVLVKENYMKVDDADLVSCTSIQYIENARVFSNFFSVVLQLLPYAHEMFSIAHELVAINEQRQCDQ